MPGSLRTPHAIHPRSRTWRLAQGDVDQPHSPAGRLGGGRRQRCRGRPDQNALDWLILLAENDPPYLANKPIGLVTTAGGVQGLQAINTMDFIARALRGWSVPLVLPVAQSWQSFDPDGHLKDEAVASQLRKLGAEVVRAARQFRSDGTCDYADEAGVAREAQAALDSVESP